MNLVHDFRLYRLGAVFLTCFLLLIHVWSYILLQAVYVSHIVTYEKIDWCKKWRTVANYETENVHYMKDLWNYRMLENGGRL